MNELEKSAISKGLRAPLAALFLLGYHTYAAQKFGNGDGDLEKAHFLVERYLAVHPNVSQSICKSQSIFFFEF